MIKLNNNNNNDIIKGKVKIVRQLYPKIGSAIDNDFKILSVEPVIIEQGEVKVDDIWGTFVIKGNAPNINYVDTYSVTLKEGYNEKYGKQYDILYIGTPMDLEDTASQKVFLSKILTEKQYETLYNTLDNPFQTIKNEDIELLTKCKGIGAKTAIKLIEKYKSTIDYSEAYVELDKYGLTPKMIVKLVETYKSPNLAVEKVKENPYLLSQEVDGIGFKRADQIAINSGIDPLSIYRIQAFILSYLNEQAHNGNSYVHPSRLFGAMFDVLEFERNNDNVNQKVVEALYKLQDDKRIWFNDKRDKICLTHIKELEKRVAEELLRISLGENNFVYNNWEDVIQETEKRQGWSYTSQQYKGIKTVLKHQCAVVTGLGGTGKSSIVSGMLDILNKKHGYTFIQGALSGKAGARLAEVTGEDGYTIHRMLGYNPQYGFYYNQQNPLPYDIVIIDEISMLGLNLFLKLLEAIATGTKLIMLGDSGQLESIGIGNLLKDMIDSNIIPVVILTEIHRQAKKSAIVTESLKARAGEQLTDSKFAGTEIRGELQDLVLDIYHDKELTSHKLITYFQNELEKVDSIMDIQVIVPMKTRGSSCTFELNKQLQDIYNPKSKKLNEVEISFSADRKYILREGCKVINRKNNYDTVSIDGSVTPIFNGDVGIIREIDGDVIIIEFQRTGDVIVPKTSWKYIELGYAMTVHSSQGSEYDTVIIGIDYTSYMLLSKELIYTAITRAKKRCILCCENSALRRAINTSNVKSKQTFLKDYLNSLKQLDKFK